MANGIQSVKMTIQVVFDLFYITGLRKRTQLTN